MPGYSLNSIQERVRFKNRKNAADEQQDAEILISSSFEENQGSEEEESSLIKLKICFHPAIISITLLIFLVALGTWYYSTNIQEGSILQGSPNGSCVPLQRVEEVIITTEVTDFKSCSDNKTCHSFLDTIEQEHNGLKYNFVVGERGELYIGAGFKCLINSDESALYVKLLASKKSESLFENLKLCFRLTEIINHGVLCDKISTDYAIQADHIESHTCSILESEKNKSFHVHDPGHEKKLIHGDFGWTVCGDFSTTKNMDKSRVITLESLPKNVCIPLQPVDEIYLDCVETPPVDCSDVSSCVHSFEEHHDGRNYNFIIGHHHGVYVGLGFNCKADNISDNTLKIKVLNLPLNQLDIVKVKEIHPNKGLIYKVLQIIDEGIACGRISETFSVKANCNLTDFFKNLQCNYDSKDLKNKIKSRYWVDLIHSEGKYYNISSEHGRGVVPRNFRFHFCHPEHPSDISTSVLNSTTEETSTTPSQFHSSESYEQSDYNNAYVDQTNLTYIDHDYY